MTERELRNLIEAVRKGTITRRQFVGTMLGVGIAAPFAGQLLMHAGIAQAQTGTFYKPTKRGGGGALKVLWWQGATLLNPHFAVGTKDQSVEGKLVDCFVLTDQGCAEAAVAKLKADHTLFVMVEVHHDTKAQTDEIKLTGWLYGAGGKAIVAQSVFCRACRNDTLGPTAEDLAEALFAVQGQGTGIVKIASTPPGARVLIDGTPAGKTPWEQGLRPGPHTVTVELSGYRTQTKPIEIKKDETLPVDVALQAEGGGGGCAALWPGSNGASAPVCRSKAGDPQRPVGGEHGDWGSPWCPDRR